MQKNESSLKHIKSIKFEPDLNVSNFIASRLSKKNSQGYSSFITTVASIAVAISIAFMILAVTISRGYDQNIRKKIFGFQGHIQITDVSSTLGVEENPLNKTAIFKQPLQDEDWVKSINYYALKSGLIKTDDAIQGIIVKGVEDEFNWNNFQDFLIEGAFPKNKDEILVSTALRDLFQFKLGDKVRLYFIQEPIRARAPIISGFYNTNMVELDEKMVFTNIEMIRALNGWKDTEVGGVEITINDPEQSALRADDIQRNFTDYNKWVKSIDQSNPEIFDWLNFLKTNQWIILILMGIVAIVNMVSMLLVLILERSKMIGVLKALGSQYTLIRNIFLRKSMQIILFGLLFGNLFGLGLALAQQKFNLIALDPEMYFLSHVPVSIHWPTILALNIGTALVILASLLVPTLLIKRIHPIQALRFN